MTARIQNPHNTHGASKSFKVSLKNTPQDDRFACVINMIDKLVETSSPGDLFATQGMSSENLIKLLIEMNSTIHAEPSIMDAAPNAVVQAPFSKRNDALTQESSTPYIRLSEKPAMYSAKGNTSRQVEVSLMNGKNSPLATYSVPVHKDVDLKEVVKNAKIDVRLYIEEEVSQLYKINNGNNNFVSNEQSKKDRHRDQETAAINAIASKNLNESMESKIEDNRKGQLEQSRTSNQVFKKTHEALVELHHDDNLRP